MNQKLCKRLRRAAAALTVGRPERELYWHGVGRAGGYQLMHTNGCTRGMYRGFKKLIKRGMVPGDVVPAGAI